MPDENTTSENVETMRARERADRRAANREAWQARIDYQPARGYSWPAFSTGNIASVTHGFHSARLGGILTDTSVTLTWPEWADLLHRLEQAPDRWRREELADHVRRILDGPCDLCGSTACPEKPDPWAPAPMDPMAAPNPMRQTAHLNARAREEGRAHDR